MYSPTVRPGLELRVSNSTLCASWAAECRGAGVAGSASWGSSRTVFRATLSRGPGHDSVVRLTLNALGTPFDAAAARFSEASPSAADLDAS
jgi:hypothetical protein